MERARKHLPFVATRAVKVWVCTRRASGVHVATIVVRASTLSPLLDLRQGRGGLVVVIGPRICYLLHDLFHFLFYFLFYFLLLLDRKFFAFLSDLVGRGTPTAARRLAWVRSNHALPVPLVTAAAVVIGVRARRAGVVHVATVEASPTALSPGRDGRHARG